MIFVDFASLDWGMFALWTGIVALIVVIFIVVLLVLSRHPVHK
jgi:hypothetical protein